MGTRLSGADDSPDGFQEFEEAATSELTPPGSKLAVQRRASDEPRHAQPLSAVDELLALDAELLLDDVLDLLGVRSHGGGG